MDHFETFGRTLANCIEEMFARDDGQNPCRHEGAPSVTDEEVVISSIGFACQYARGGIVLFATRADTQAFRPAEMEGGSDAVDCDVIGEVSNMLVGRLKNQLLNRNVVLMVGTPMTTIAKAARAVASTEPTSSRWYAVETSGGRFDLRFDVCFEPGFALGDEPSAPQPSAGNEGDMLFF